MGPERLAVTAAERQRAEGVGGDIGDRMAGLGPEPHQPGIRGRQVRRRIVDIGCHAGKIGP